MWHCFILMDNQIFSNFYFYFLVVINIAYYMNVTANWWRDVLVSFVFIFFFFNLTVSFVLIQMSDVIVCYEAWIILWDIRVTYLFCCCTFFWEFLWVVKWCGWCFLILSLSFYFNSFLWYSVSNDVENIICLFVQYFLLVPAYIILGLTVYYYLIKFF